MEKNRNLNDFIAKSVKEAGYEKPSLNFTDLVISKIGTEKQSVTTMAYEPLLSRKAWAGILCFVALVFAYLLIGDVQLDARWLARLNSLTSFNLSGSLLDISVSSTLIYALLIGTFFVVVQVFMIKNYVDRRYGLG